MQTPAVLELFLSLLGDAHITREAATLNNYASKWAMFDNFLLCHAPKGFKWIDATGATVAAFLTMVRIEAQERGVGYAAVKAASAAVACRFLMSGMLSPTDHPLCRLARSEAQKILRSTPLHRDELTAAHLHTMARKYVHARCDLRTRMHFTCLVLSFVGFLRYDDLSKVLVHHELLQIYPTHMAIFLYKSKTDTLWEGAWIHIARLKAPSLCSVSLVEDLIEQGGYQTVPRQGSNEEDLGPLLRGTVSMFGHNARLSQVTSTLWAPIPPLGYKAYKESIKNLAEGAGISERILPHSGRIGGATAAANSGVPDRLFKLHGRWKSESAKDGYIRSDLAAKCLVSLGLGL